MLKAKIIPRLRMVENMAKAVCSSKNSILSISSSVCVSAGEGGAAWWGCFCTCVRVKGQFTRCPFGKSS